MGDTYRLGFTGDVMLGRLVNDIQQTRPPPAVWGTIHDCLIALDGLFINLECCLSRQGDKWTRTHRPFHFRADPAWAIPALEAVGVDWACLANNHVLDYGEVALADTLDELDRSGIAHAGAGMTAADAWEPVRVSVGELEIALIAFTDNTPEYAADAATPGTARVDIAPGDTAVRNRVRQSLKTAHRWEPDLLVVSGHWGPNMVTTPASSFETFAHWLIDQGVDVIHGHSAHVFQGIEVYDGGLVLYDTGDFVDDYAVDDDLRNDRSFLFELMVTESGVIDALRLRPTEISNYAVHRASGHAAEWSRTRMRTRSKKYDTSFRRDGEDLVVDELC